MTGGAGAARSRIVVGTRGSPLAQAQTRRAVDALRRRRPDLDVAVLVVTTAGDAAPETPLAELGLGVFTSALEAALLDGRIDAAAHSLKDLSALMPEGLALGAVLEREDARDVLVSRDGAPLNALPPGATVGTGSPRRAALLRALRPELVVLGVRGNVGTRLGKLREGQYDALVLAAAGLGRLGLQEEATQWLDPAVFIPAVGQGAIALQRRADDDALRELLAPLDHGPTRAAVTAERAFLRAMGGGCRTPMGAHAVVEGAALRLAGMAADITGSPLYRGVVEGAAGEAEALGAGLAQALRAQGADALLAEGAA